MASSYQPGEFVLHVSYGPCAVVGVQTDPLAGECLAIKSTIHTSAVIRIPVSKLADHAMPVLTPDEAAEAARMWTTQTASRLFRSRSNGGNRGRDMRASALRIQNSRVADQRDAKPLPSDSLAAC
ncbi:hypothetical protein [Terricaulis sp.]|uniref:hypothetical protein n=1 Tax=Terricaulis sp. TaxID=2768686 RepID=UPI003784410D